ncbi:MAG: outer membrane beta-barrel protein [Alphaproteobacteria bacterium]|nr:outer membrane beta-barrel protein [Alphaproteobacteria bacterium]
MNIKKSILFALVPMLCVGAAEATPIAWYVGGSVGFGGQHIDGTNLTAQSYGALAGIDVPFLRFDAEYNYLTSTKSGERLNAHIAMANAYVKMENPMMVTPYAGAGIGAVVGGDVAGYDIDTSLAFQGMLGLQFGIPTTHVFLDLEGRALYSPNVIEDSGLFHYDLRVKLRYAF